LTRLDMLVIIKILKVQLALACVVDCKCTQRNNQIVSLTCEVQLKVKVPELCVIVAGIGERANRANGRNAINLTCNSRIYIVDHVDYLVPQLLRKANSLEVWCDDCRHLTIRVTELVVVS